ncbi:hypothetical protein GCM10023160_19910 [Brachybacterium paraconglomeratum]
MEVFILLERSDFGRERSRWITLSRLPRPHKPFGAADRASITSQTPQGLPTMVGGQALRRLQPARWREEAAQSLLRPFTLGVFFWTVMRNSVFD